MNLYKWVAALAVPVVFTTLAGAQVITPVLSLSSPKSPAYPANRSETESATDLKPRPIFAYCSPLLLYVVCCSISVELLVDH